ncbi:hypothetical protein JTE90_013827 [Oedothorax gibbosus]|uniref:Uncharacterized protein n=1 Tax=Oedothorax gibbosus TaxID=931172 RepID=A0AAV6VKC3_9ARAC|nr:hypothetical protein JTE90_013827 [Oedothorax gibbosus]
MDTREVIDVKRKSSHFGSICLWRSAFSLTLPLSAASSPSLYRPPPHPPSIGRLLTLPLSAASSPSLYRPPPHPPSIGRLRILPLSAVSSPSLYRPPPQPPPIGNSL